MKLSIIMPTLFPGMALPMIEDTRKQLAGIDYEFVIVSPHEISGPDIVHVPETEPKGPSAAAMLGLARATGDVIMVAGDDIRYGPRLAAETLAQFAKPDRPFPMALAFPRMVGRLAMAETMYGRLMPSFYGIGRRDIDAIGLWQDPQFVAAFGDYDLGYRIHAAGGKVRLANVAFFEVADRSAGGKAPTKRLELAAADFQRFRRKWAHTRDPAWGADQDGVQLLIPAHLLQFLSPQPDMLDADGPGAVRDLRALALLALTSLMQNFDMPIPVSLGALEYLRWLSAAGDNPQHVAVHDTNRFFVARPKG